MAQHVAVDGKHPPRCRHAWRERGASSGGARTGRGSGPRGPRTDACCAADRSVPWRRQRPRQDDGSRLAVRRVPGRVIIQAHHAMPWRAPLVLSTSQGHAPMKPRRMAALVKPIPWCAVRQRGPNGRLQRDGVALSMNPSCLRVVSQRVALARQTGGRSTARHDCALSCPRLAVRRLPGADDPRAG
jgi:hypothetical protein